MSGCCYQAPISPVSAPMMMPRSNCICSLPTLVILILVVLQFSKHKVDCCDEEDGFEGYNQVGNGILFIVALFFLSCVGCGRGAY